MNIRCLLFGHDWQFRTYTKDDLLIKKKYLDFITESKAICRRCGKEKIWRNRND